MKNKLIVMFLTFIIMILITPVIFSKLMNNRYDTMLLNLSQNGYKIKTLKENSGYLKSERILDITIPGDKLGLNQVKYIKVKVKTYFKNLPVTDVYFEGKIKDIKLKYKNPLIENLAKKVEFKAVTPNFKIYAFSINPAKYKDFSMDTVKGKLDIKNKILTFNTNFSFKENNLTIKIFNLNSFIERKKDFFKSKETFNIRIQVLDKYFNIKIKNNRC